MSHEGIRFVNAAEARAQALEEERSAAIFPPEATEPAKVRVHKTEGTGMEITWRDGHHSAWSFKWLRDACPCATCHEEREKSGRQPGAPKSTPASLLPMYQAPPRPDIVTPVGRYAISFHWNDGHSSGIYSWDYLRGHCQCDACLAYSTGKL